MCSIGEKGPLGCPECGSEKLYYRNHSYYNCECGWTGFVEELLTELEYKQKNRKNKLKKLNYEN